MIASRHALLLVGSAKRPRSTSEALGKYALEQLRERGLSTETLFLHRAFDAEGRGEAPFEVVDRADIVLLATPLYVDSLPYLVVQAMERIAEHHAGRPHGDPPRFAAIVNCGFPESHHAKLAVRMCGLFAKAVGWEWAGGLALGGGEAIGGEPLSKSGGRLRNVSRALDLTADALAAGQAVPEEAVALMAKPMMPTWLYTWFGNWGWKRRAARYGAQHRLGDRPHAL